MDSQAILRMDVGFYVGILFKAPPPSKGTILTGAHVMFRAQKTL